MIKCLHDSISIQNSKFWVYFFTSKPYALNLLPSTFLLLTLPDGYYNIKIENTPC